MVSVTLPSRRNYWGRLGSARNRLLVLSIAGIVPTICVALAGFYTIARLTEKTRAIVVATTSLRNHWEGDMMHDDLRGDVYAALVAKPIESALRPGLAWLKTPSASGMLSPGIEDYRPSILRSGGR